MLAADCACSVSRDAEEGVNMATPQDQFQRLLREAHDDARIVGLVLTGSRGKGFGNEASDYDVMMVVAPEALPAFSAQCEAAQNDESWQGIDWWVTSLAEVEMQASAWSEPLAWEILCNERYSLADVSVLVDKTGQLRRLLDETGFIPAEHRLPVVRTALGAYTNSLYRSLKCLRNRNRLGARLEAADAIGHALTAIFALEGRHRPYYGYLARELAAHPLAQFPLPAADLLALIETILDSADASAQQRLLAIVDTLGRQAGCADAFDEWGADYDWMRLYRPAEPPD
jgi:hypothetical protein